MSLRSPAWRRAQRRELADACAASDARSLSERAEEAVALYLLTLSEIARTSADRDEMVRRLTRREGPAVNLRERWLSRPRAHGG